MDMTTFAATREVLVQGLAAPAPDVHANHDLYVFMRDGAQYIEDGELFDIPKGGVLDLDTYMNLFNLGTWTRNANLEGLVFRLEGSGHVFVSAYFHTQNKPNQCLFEREIDLTDGHGDLDFAELFGAQGPHGALPERDGLIGLRIIAVDGPATIMGGGWYTTTRSPNPVRFAISVTSFRREAETMATVRRVTKFLDDETNRLGADVDLFVVDNGQTLELADHPRLRVIPNRNLGGAGGFARGLAEARAGDYTHVLFTDDDAAFTMENLRRTIAFFRLAKSPKAAVSGAMISTGSPNVMWENGSRFDLWCRHQFQNTNLLNKDDFHQMELEAAKPKPSDFYGAWWFFAFPVAAVSHDPYPFFVRGDDIAFGLSNDFKPVTLSGVVSFQGDFSSKQSPFTFYLDLRNHLVQHLVHDRLNTGPWQSAGVALRFTMRNLVRMHYESAEAQLEAWSDVMKGPRFFAENADMSVRGPEIAALTRIEKLQDVGELPEDALVPVEPSPQYGRFMRAHLNGHLLPLFGIFAKTVHVPAQTKRPVWATWGAREATFYDETGTRAYTVTHDKARGLKIIFRAVVLTARWVSNYARLRAEHQAGMTALTNPGFWQNEFQNRGGPGLQSDPGSSAKAHPFSDPVEA